MLIRFTRALAIAVAVVGLASAGAARAQDANLRLTEGAAGADALRSAGCSGCFGARMTSTLNSFSKVDRIFMLCAVGFPGGGLDDCYNGTDGDLQDLVVIQGDLKNKDTDPNGLGVSGGETNVTYRVTAHGSSRGINCARGDLAAGVGWLVPEGLDGLPNTADDAGGSGTFGVPGPGGPAGQVGTANMVAAPLASCTGRILPRWPLLADVDVSSASELCVVNFDLNANGQLANLQDGRAITAAPGAVGSGESTVGQAQCDVGYADLPTSDFADPSLNTKQFGGGGDVFGAQIFKMIVSSDVHAVGDATKKVALADPQIENLFASATASSYCSWSGLGADANTTNDNLNVCFRKAGSGTKEVFRNTFLVNAAGDRIETTGAEGAGTATACVQKDEAGNNILPPRFKTAIQNPANFQVQDCVQARDGAVGYVDAIGTAVAGEFYGAIVEGVDPDSNDLKTLVKCGGYRFWGPLAGGYNVFGTTPTGLTGYRGNATPTRYEAADFTALKKPAVFATNPSYLPLDGVAVSKSATDGAYTLKFVPSNCPAQPNPPALIP